MINWFEQASTISLDVKDVINGVPSPSDASSRVEKFSPRDGKLLYSYRESSEQNIHKAVTSARQSFNDGRWSDLSIQYRKDTLFKLADLMIEHKEELALLESLDVGKPISDALLFDVPHAAAVIRYSAEALDKVYGQVLSVGNGHNVYEIKRPVGVVAAITGWNFPLMLAATKIGPALAMGNSLILKPSEISSLSTAKIAELALEAGMPDGVFNVIHGTGQRVGQVLADHMDIDSLTFTGSTAIGKRLLQSSSDSNMKRLQLECGGKAAHIIFNDCPDLDAAAEAVIAKAFYNQGQVCVAGSRLLVQADIKAQLMTRVQEKLKALTVGDPLDPATQFGPLISRQQFDKVTDYIHWGNDNGLAAFTAAPLANGLPGGFYIAPTVFDNVDPKSKIAQEEIFGPVLTVISFDDEEEAIAIANSTVYGLSTVVWTQNMATAHKLAYRLTSGWILIHSSATSLSGPTVGTLSVEGQKQSGWGAEGGMAGFEAYTNTSTVQMTW